jgi:hypothetical protein
MKGQNTAIPDVPQGIWNHKYTPFSEGCPQIEKPAIIL